MNGENASDWMIAGQQYGIDTRFMFQDKTRKYDMLLALGLPYPPFYLFREEEIGIEVARSLFAEGKSFFCRLIPKEATQRRPYKLRIHGIEELQAFLSQHHLGDYREMHLVEKPDVFYTGGIIAQDAAPSIPGSCIFELVPGDGPDLFHGKKNPLSGYLNLHRMMRFTLLQPTDLERKLLTRALDMIGGRNHPFPGYYEFDVWKGEEIKFRTYQSPTTAYAQL